MPDPTDELILEIMRSLEIDAQWIRYFDATAAEGIAAARSAGRRAGRALKVKVTTHQTPPAAGQVVVIVAMREVAPEDKARLLERAVLLMEAASARKHRPDAGNNIGPP
ncbi:MAG TPA: hypothetical protein VIW24_30470 [Aldersonia sp.]